MENISEGQWLVSGMSEGEVRAPLVLNGGKHRPSHFQLFLILMEYDLLSLFHNFLFNLFQLVLPHVRLESESNLTIHCTRQTTSTR